MLCFMQHAQCSDTQQVKQGSAEESVVIKFVFFCLLVCFLPLAIPWQYVKTQEVHLELFRVFFSSLFG